jgi:hypothetical protein
MARVWYRAVSVLLIRRRRPIGEPAAATIDARRAGGVGILDGTAGAGRTCHAIAELGDALDSVVQAVIDPDAPAHLLGDVDVGRRFEVVVLGSHLVNLPDKTARRGFLAVARRHVASGGTVLVEHHPLDWAETAAETKPTPGSDVGMTEVRRTPPFVSAVSTFDIGGRLVRQPFRARVLSDAELATELTATGLAVRQRLGPTWLEAAPAPESA